MNPREDIIMLTTTLTASPVSVTCLLIVFFTDSKNPDRALSNDIGYNTIHSLGQNVGSRNSSAFVSQFYTTALFPGEIEPYSMPE